METLSLKGALKTWIAKYRGAVQLSVPTADAFEERYGSLGATLALEHNTAFKLCSVLRRQDPPVYITDQVSLSTTTSYYYY